MRKIGLLLALCLIYRNSYHDASNQLYNFAGSGQSMPFTQQTWLDTEMFMHEGESEYDADLKFHLLLRNHIIVKVYP